MTEKKFNLKTYQKISGDEPIEKRLQEEHVKEQDTINEEQLEEGRVPEADTIIEDLLEKTRTGKAVPVTERQLDTASGGLVKQRNPEAYTGDMNKLEEKRLLSNDVQEDEKYEAASEVAPKFRWWETPTGEDLKLANDFDVVVKTAQVEEMTFDTEQQWGALDDSWQEEEGIDTEFTGAVDDFEVEEAKSGKVNPSMFITKNKYLSGVLPGVYMALDYKVEDFQGNQEEIIAAAMNKVLSEDPRLEGKISPTDFSIQDSEGLVGTVTLRALGDEFASLAEGPVDDIAKSETPSNMFSEESYKESDVGGTPMAIGSIKASEVINNDGDEAELEAKAVQFITERHPNLQITADSLDLSKVQTDGSINYMVQIGDSPEESDDFGLEEVSPVSPIEASNDFPVVVAVKKKPVA